MALVKCTYGKYLNSKFLFYVFSFQGKENKPCKMNSSFLVHIKVVSHL